MTGLASATPRPGLRLSQSLFQGVLASQYQDILFLPLLTGSLLCVLVMRDGLDCRGRGANPIAHVLQAIDEPLDLIEYNRWNVVLPEGQFLTEVGNAQFEEVLQQVSPSGIPQWQVGLSSALAVPNS